MYHLRVRVPLLVIEEYSICAYLQLDIGDEESCENEEVSQFKNSPTIDDFIVHLNTTAPSYWKARVDEMVASGKIALATDAHSLLQDAFQEGVSIAASTFPNLQNMASQIHGMADLSQPAADPLGPSNIAHMDCSMALPIAAIPMRELSAFGMCTVPSQSIDTTRAAHNNEYDSGYGSNSPSCNCECHCVMGSSSQSTYGMKPVRLTKYHD